MCRVQDVSINPWIEPHVTAPDRPTINERQAIPPFARLTSDVLDHPCTRLAALERETVADEQTFRQARICVAFSIPLRYHTHARELTGMSDLEVISSRNAPFSFHFASPPLGWLLASGVSLASRPALSAVIEKVDAYSKYLATCGFRQTESPPFIALQPIAEPTPDPIRGFPRTRYEPFGVIDAM